MNTDELIKGFFDNNIIGMIIGIMIISCIIKILYFISLHHKSSCIEYELEEANKKLERIANALEQDTEPYVIEEKETVYICQ